MSKTLLFSITGLATAVAATTYYVSPAFQTDLDVAPISVAEPTVEVRRKLQKASVKNFAAAWGITKTLNAYSAHSGLIDPRVVWTSADVMEITLSVTNERVLKVTATILPSRNDECLVDVQAEMLDSTFSQNEILQPYDLKVMAMAADSVVTEYLDSLLKERRIASSKELEERLFVESGFDRDQARSFGRRLEVAFEESYKPSFETAYSTISQRQHQNGSGWASDAEVTYASDPANGAIAAARAAKDAVNAAEVDFDDGSEWGD